MTRELHPTHPCCQSHCCILHGCKYSDEDCPVANGELIQDHPCYHCHEEGIKEIPKTSIGYFEVAHMKCAFGGTWRKWIEQTCFDGMFDPDFRMPENWKLVLAGDLALVNPDVLQGGEVNLEELKKSFKNLLSVIFNDRFGYYDEGDV